jgi:transposase-like protein
MAYICSAVYVDSGGSTGDLRLMETATKFLRMVLGRCINKPLLIVDRGPWYRWTLERLGLKYMYQTFGMRDRVERFFRYLKERTIVFHHKLKVQETTYSESQT